MCCVAALAGLLIAPPRLAAQSSLEYQVKAAFLLNFAKFVDWPSSAFVEPESPLVICVLGKDPFGRTLDELVQNETVGGRKVVVRRVAQIPAAGTCHVLFEAAGKDIIKNRASLGPNILTAAEGGAFVREGGMIGFVIENRRVRFDINQTAAESAALKLSSKLLSVARAIEK